jgi:Ca2+/Na+ antiporter
MIRSYARKSNIGVVVFLVGIAVAIVATNNHPHENIWDNNLVLAEVGVIAAIGGWFYGLWAYVRAKGRSDAWVLMAFLSVVGLIVLLCLKDKQKEGTAATQALPDKGS